MARERGPAVGIWLLTTLLVAGGALLAYHLFNRTDDLAGRADPAQLYDDPALLFIEPGLLGTAVELRVTEAVDACMEEAGFAWRGPAVVEDLDSLLDPSSDGYGIAAGPPVEPPRLGPGGPASGATDAYEAALYGTGLAGTAGADGGCAAAGRDALDQALAALAALPYSLEQLEADALSHPAYVAALTQWSACMSGRGFQAASPDELVAAQAAALAAASPEEALALADYERQAADADFSCRAGTIDQAIGEIAAQLGPAFVEANRPQLEVLIPAAREEQISEEGLGTGDVQVTLRWWSTVDLDLSVTDPAGERIYFSHPDSASGGRLDRDANYPCDTATGSPVENVFWPPGGAPAGDYLVTVTYQTSCGDRGSQDYELIVRLDGDTVQHVRSTISYGQNIGLDLSFEGP
jgi:hypothetical protein